MPFSIIRDDITKMKTDAIVNAANSALKMGGGVCGSIFSAAGAEKLQAECDRIGYCAIGESVITKGYSLNSKYIIHTVGPIYGKDPENEEMQLYSCYKNSLILAKRYNLQSIAFPLISSGIYGYPKDEALKIATKAIKDFLQNEEMDIYLVVYDKGSFMMSKSLYEDVKSFIEEREVKEDRRRCDEAYSYVMLSDNMPACAPVPEMSRLTKKKSLKELLDTEEETFSQMMLRLIDEKGMSDVEVYKRANIDRKLFSKMRKKDYCPKKSTVMAVIIALKLDMREARELLGRAGYAFSVSSKSDIIIEYFIENRNFDIFAVNETLFQFDQPLLGA